MTDAETKHVNRLIQALTNQRNNALNEAANYAAQVQERDETIAMLQQIIAAQSNAAPGSAAAPPFPLGALIKPPDDGEPGAGPKEGNGEANVH
jgi:hypothetical protein